MRCRLIIVFLLFRCVANPVTGQENKLRETQSYVVVPNEIILLVIASQSGVPIQFEDANLLMSVDGRELAVAYNLHNSGAKAIRYLTPMMWTSFDTGGTLTGPGLVSGATTGELMMPGQTMKVNRQNKIVPLP